jgi:hypothetical protein
MKPKFTLSETMNRFSTEEACKEFLQERRWSNGVKYSRCNNDKVYALKARPFHWICKAKTCGGRNGYRFSVLTKTIFENTNYPLKIWFQVIYLMLQSKNGISALQIQRIIGSGEYKTAWHMCHRIRAAMKDGDSASGWERLRLTRPLSVAGNQPPCQQAETYSRNEWKFAMIGAIARKGNVVC